MEPSDTTHAPGSHTVRVLVAEPDASARRLYVDALRPLGCDAIEAADGREALVEALVRRPSVIVIESRLPLVNGPALCEILRRDSQTCTVPIVVIAPDSGAADAERVRRAGATLVLTKPVAADRLALEVQRLSASGPVAPSVLVPAPALSEPPPPARRKRIANSKAHVRYTTTTPPEVPPALRCPSCDGPLLYERSHLGGVNARQPEQWDDYLCPSCGTFEYRHRTRRLRELGQR